MDSKVERYVIIEGDVKNACLDYNTVAIEKRFMGAASPNMEMSRNSTSVTDSTNCINIEILCS
jgi:hypothetical protein